MASKRIAGITGELILNVNKWSSGIKQAQKDSDALQSALKPLSRAADEIGKPMLAAGTAITAAFGAMSKVAADYGDQLSEVSSKTGLTTQDLGKLKFAAEQNDTSFDGLSTGLKFLSKNLIEAATGGKEQERVFKALGISVKDIHGDVRPLNDVLLQSSDIFKRLPDGPEKAALAMKLFGKSGADLIPLLNQGSAGIEKFGQRAEELGLVVDGATAALGDDFNNALNETKNAALGFSVTVGNVLLPALTDAVNKGNSAIVWAKNFAQEFPGATKAAAGLGVVLTGAGGLIVGLGTLGTIAPKVAAGFDLIGGRATLLKASLVGLAIGGVLFLKNEFDKLEQSGMFKGGFWEDAKEAALSLAGPYAAARAAVISFRDAWEQLTGKSRSMEESLGDVTNKLKNHGQAHIDAAAAVANQGKETDKYSAELQKLISGLTKTNKEVDEHANKIKQLREAFQSSLKPADDLEKTLKLLGDTVSRKDVLAVYGDQIIEATAKQKAHGFEVSNNISLLNAMALGAKAVNRELELVRADIDATSEAFLVLAKHKAKPVELDPRVGQISDTLGETGNAFAKLGRESLEAGAQIRKTEEDITRLTKEGYSSAVIMERFGSEIEAAANASRKLGIPLGETTAAIIRQTDASARLIQRSRELQDSWGSAMRNLSERSADAFADMVVSGDFNFKKLGDIAKSTASDMLGSFIKGFVSPFTDALAGLGRTAANALSGLLFGSTGGQSANGGAGGAGGGGILANLINGAGGGGSAAGGGFSVGGLDIGSYLSAAMSGFGTGNRVQAGISGFMLGGPVGAALGALFGAGRQAHDAANDIVKSQNAFTENAAKLLVDSTLTGTQKLNIFEQMWSEFQANARAFAGNDPKNQIVMNQAFATLQDFITTTRRDLAPWVEKEKELQDSEMGFAKFSTAVDKFVKGVERFVGEVGSAAEILGDLPTSIDKTFASVEDIVGEIHGPSGDEIEALIEQNKLQVQQEKLALIKAKEEATLAFAEDKKARLAATEESSSVVPMGDVFGNVRPFEEWEAEVADTLNRQLMATFRMTTNQDLLTQAEMDRNLAVQPMGMMAGDVAVTVQIDAPINIDGTGKSATEVRDDVIPEITKALETGIRGVREKWAQLLVVRSPGTLVPTGI